LRLLVVVPVRYLPTTARCRAGHDVARRRCRRHGHGVVARLLLLLLLWLLLLLLLLKLLLWLLWLLLLLLLVLHL